MRNLSNYVQYTENGRNQYIDYVKIKQNLCHLKNDEPNILISINKKNLQIKVIQFVKI